MKLQIEKAVYGGSGLAHQLEAGDSGPNAGPSRDRELDRTKGQAVFVPFTLPGEIVEAALTEQRSGFAEASLQQVLVASADRIQPECAHFGACGGCHYQHAAYPAQVVMKSAILHETLERAGLTDLPAIQPHTSHPWAYRNRTRLRIAELDGQTRVGYNRRGSNDFLPIHECPISAPLLWRAAEALLQVATEDTPGGRWARRLSEAEFFTTADEQKLQMTLFIQKDQPGFNPFCVRMKELLPELTGAGSLLLPSTGSRRAGKPRQLANWGAEGLIYHAATEDYWVSRGGFFQVNRFLIDELVNLVTSRRNGNLAWDLYAGVGLFSRALAKNFQQVVAVEAAPTDLQRSFKGQGRHAVEATTVEFLRSAVIQRDRPELIVMDPPRAGVGPEVCTLLIRIAAPEIVYVSCDPVTLARDLKQLTEARYRLDALHMTDLFPQTFHLETVAILRKE